MSFFSHWKDKATQFAEVRLNLLKLTVIERASSVLGYLVYTFVLMFLLLAVLLFFGIGLQEWFTHLLDNRIAGAFLTMAFYILLLVLAFVLRKAILAGFSGVFISIITAQEKDDDDYEDHPHGKKITVED